MSILKFAIGLSIALLGLGANAQRMPVPIIDHDNVPVAVAPGKMASPASVKEAIIAAARNKAWEVTEQSSGKLVATLHVRGKHTVVTEITYNAENFSLKYRDSTNMKYEAAGKDGKPAIHPFYNRWVIELKDAITKELARS